MVVWFAHVRVGHRQLSILKYPPTLACRGIFFARNISFYIWEYIFKDIIFNMFDF